MTSAALVAAIMIVLSVVARRLAPAVTNRRANSVVRFVAAAAFEIAFVCALFSLWQFANRLTRGHSTGGLHRGREIYHDERIIHLPTERSVQRIILGHPDVVRVANYYYDTAHLTVMFVFLIWLWLRHRDKYPFYRNMLAFFTGMSLLIQTVAVAPPRLIGGTGLVDTAALYGQSVYAVIGSNIADQYAAMPSIHVGWAMLVSLAVVSASTSRWRWIFLLYGPLTFFVVVATANHYWLDGFAAIGLLVIAWFLAHGVLRVKARIALRTPVDEPAQIQQAAFS
jgi:PAP2 superfamily